VVAALEGEPAFRGWEGFRFVGWVLAVVPAIYVSTIEQNVQNNAEYTHSSTPNNVLQCLYVGILHEHRVFPLRILDVLFPLEEIADVFFPKEKSFIVYKLM